MLKKAGIVVATAAAGVLAVSPLAFAGDKGKDHSDPQPPSITDTETNTNEGDSSLLDVSDNNVNVPVNVCDNQVPVNVLGVQVPVNDTEVIADLAGALGLGLLGSGAAEAEDGNTTLDDSCKNKAQIADSDTDVQSND